MLISLVATPGNTLRKKLEKYFSDFSVFRVHLKWILLGGGAICCVLISFAEYKCDCGRVNAHI